MKIIRTLHTYYGLMIFSLLFLVFFPLFLIPINFPNQFKLVGIFNRWWAWALFFMMLLPFRVIASPAINKKKQYIFCPNHFSYLDIPTMGLNPVNSIFVGKNDMEKIPLFGFMYRKLHITVDRARLKSRVNSLKGSMKAIDAGKSLVIFPEGGMITKHPPRMYAFKDGAFRTAIEKQIPVVPVTIPHNWIILPDRYPLRLHWSRVVVIFHDPIETRGYTLQDVDSLKKQVYEVINTELKQYENQSGNTR